MSRPTRPTRGKILEPLALRETLSLERAAGRTVVFTNGCFDLLHAGHLHLLEQAAALGDVLVVGLNGDGSVRRLKGKARPFVPFAERAEHLAALAVVDYVVGFEEDTPEALVLEVRPHVLVKGGDWQADSIVGREGVEGDGGVVVRVPLKPGLSTTDIARKVRASSGRRGSSRRPMGEKGGRAKT